jgi:hypothetical protein
VQKIKEVREHLLFVDGLKVEVEVVKKFACKNVSKHKSSLAKM